MEEIDMTVSPTLQKYLDQSASYDLIPHAPTMSSTRTAQALSLIHISEPTRPY